MTRLPRALTFISVLVAGVHCATGYAQPYPARTVRVIVTYAPGGGSDILGRMIGAKAGEELGQLFVIDNRPGGNATIGTQMIARAVPDGYTIGVIDTALTMNPGLFTKLPYDAAKDFAPITLIASSPLMLMVHPSVPVKSAQELIALAKSHPGQLTFGSAGAGTALHLAQELFKVVAGIDAIHVPYKGGGPAVTALVSGEVAMSFLTPATIAPFVKAGKVRALAITGEKRYPGFPDLPTLIESGIRGVDAEPWWGFVAPAGTPAAIVDRLNEIFVKHINAPEMRQRLVDAAFVPVANTPQEFAAFLRADTIKWGKAIKGAGIQAQ
jgi:tripartite-type tricarboxylate transporter receptor subunit TctC